MAITELKLRRGTTTDHQSFTGAEGEITIDTSKDTLVVHDGTTVGGHPLSKASEAKGWTTTEHYIGDGTWTKTGKAGLKRIKVTVFGGGGGGSTAGGGGGGGQGGHGYIILDVASVTDNVAITIGDGGAAGTTGGTTSFGSYIEATGGTAGASNSGMGIGGYGGTVSGLTQTTSGGKVTAGVVDLGAQDGMAGSYSATAGTSFGYVGGVGGGPGAGNEERIGTGVSGGGGGGGGDAVGDDNHTGAQGSIIIEEIYGEV